MIHEDGELSGNTDKNSSAKSMEKKWVLVGSVGKPHGIKGWIKINAYTEPFSNILLYQPWYLSASEKEPRAVEIRQHQIQDQKLVVQFADCQTPEEARLFTNRKIYVERKQLSALAHDEYYWNDLEGLEVYTCDNIYLGIIQKLLETGSNDVLVVQGEKRYLIPFLLNNTIKSIDLEQKKMLVDWDPEF